MTVLSGPLNFRRVTDGILLTCLLLATRIACRSHFLYDIDSVNFALGLRRFDPVVHQPHPPGYFLYTGAARVAARLFPDANAALVCCSVVASGGALLLIQALANRWFGRQAALFAGLLFVFSPLTWFHGTVALTYAVEAFFSALTGYLCWRVYTGSDGFVLPAAITAGLAAGFRPSFLLFLSPLWLLSLLHAPGRVRPARILAGTGALVAAVSAWFFPMVAASGGTAAYWSSLLSLWRMVPGKQTVLNSPWAIAAARLITIGGIGILCFGFASLLALRRGDTPLDRRKKIFILAWVGPGLLFFTLVYLKFVNSGYLLVISPPLFAWLGLRASRWYESLRCREAARIALVAMFAAANSLIYLLAPVYSSYASVRHFEAELQAVVRAIPQVASPADTMIVGFDSHFLGYRHAGYYLPGWYTAQFPEVSLAAGTRVFVMEKGDTHLAERLPVARFRRFVFFPLPSNDAEYTAYMTRVRARFPAGALRSVWVGGREWVSGRITDLPLLFPSAAQAGKAAEVNTAKDTASHSVSVR